MLIYAIRNTVTGKEYVGQTVQPLAKRFAHHAWASTFKTNMPIACAMRKYGSKAFEVRVLCECQTLEEMNGKEREWSERLNTMVPNGYNLRVGNGPGAMHPDVRRRISLSKKGRKPTEETRRKLRESHVGKKRSEAYTALSRERFKGRQVAVPVYRVGIFTLLNPAGEPVTIRNMREFCKNNGHSRSRMSELVTGKRTQYKGWKIG